MITQKIYFLDNQFSKLNLFIKETTPSKIFILVDKNTRKFCLPILLEKLKTNIPFQIIEIETGEQIKTIQTTAKIWEILSSFQADKKALFINLGGGVVSDIGGFASSTYKRGIDFINIPTSLLAMVDASIGGKTGINHSYFKNMVGTFSLPKQVLIYPNFIETMDIAEIRSGFAEMIKHGLIACKKHWQNLISISKISATNITPFIPESIEIKKNIVNTDFKEENIRKTLNFGHTIGHAIESLFLKIHSPITHGEAIAIGMTAETHLSFLEKKLSKEDSQNIIKNITRFYPFVDISKFRNEEIITTIFQDKKNDNGKINFSLLSNIGKGEYNKYVNIENIIHSIEFYKKSYL